MTEITTTKRRTSYQFLNIIGLLIFLSTNMLANILPLNGKNTGELSAQYPNLFVPAGITFAIWGVIYLLFILFSYHQSKQKYRTTKEGEFLDKIGVLFFISCIANAAWLFTWHYENLPASLLIMLVLLASLLTIYLRLDIGLARATEEEKHYVHIPFSIYLGWITIATIANVTVLLVSINWTGLGLGEEFWTIFVITAGTLIASLILLTRKDYFFAAVPAWALLGIIIKRTETTPTHWNIVFAAMAGIIIISIIGLTCKVLCREK